MRPPRLLPVPFAVALFAAVASSPRAAAAQNLLTNGDFAAGLSGFTVAATPGYLVSSTNECSLAGAFGSGLACAVFGTPGTGVGGASLTQTIATTPGAHYVASFVTGISPAPSGCVVFLDADGQRTQLNCLTNPACLLTLPFTATGTSTVISLGVEGSGPLGPPLVPGGALVGGAQVVTSAVVPEPAPGVLVAGGVAWLGWAAGRRRRQAVGPA